MLRPRRFDEEGLKAYLSDVRPRFLVLRVRSGKANIVWGVPLWAAEEIVAFVVGAAAILKGALPLLPAAWREKLLPGFAALGRGVSTGLSQGGAGVGASTAAANGAASAAPRSVAAEVYATIDSLAGGSLRDVLRLPPGEPYVKVQTDTAFVEIVAY